MSALAFTAVTILTHESYQHLAAIITLNTFAVGHTYLSVSFQVHVTFNTITITIRFSKDLTLNSFRIRDQCSAYFEIELLALKELVDLI